MLSVMLIILSSLITSSFDNAVGTTYATSSTVCITTYVTTLPVMSAKLDVSFKPLSDSSDKPSRRGSGSILSLHLLVLPMVRCGQSFNVHGVSLCCLTLSLSSYSHSPRLGVTAPAYQLIAPGLSAVTQERPACFTHPLGSAHHVLLNQLNLLCQPDQPQVIVLTCPFH